MPVLILYFLLSSDGPLLGLIERYGRVGRYMLYLQLVLPSSIFYGFGYWLFHRFLYQFRPFPLLAVILLTYALVYITNYASFIWLHQTVGFPARYSNQSDMADQWRLMVAHGPIGLFKSPPLFIWNFTMSFAYPSLLLAFKGLYDNRSAQLQNAQLQQQNTQLEFNYLKSQVNPHFLFNTLNSIYALTEEDNPQAALLVHQLSGLMRYTLYETGGAFVALHKEFQFIRDYVSLEQTRATKRLALSLELPDRVDENLQIAPFILITFVENAFKHGLARSSQRTWIRTRVHLQATTLHLEVSNSQPTTADATSGGLSLSNVGKRLALLYPDHRLSITRKPAEYTVQLVLSLGTIAKSY
ncbi:hypothetical protein GCM10028825_52350 [Spirosoma agri]